MTDYFDCTHSFHYNCTEGRAHLPTNTKSQSRKEKMAAQLFGGGDDTPAGMGRGRGRPSERKTARPTTSQRSTPASSAVSGDLLGSLSEPGLSGNVPPPSVSSTTSSASSLFGGMTTSQPAKKAPPTASLLDLGVGESMAPAPSAHPPSARNQRGASIDDLLGGGSEPAKSEGSTFGMGGLSLGPSSAATLRDEALPGALTMLYGDSKFSFDRFRPVESDSYIALGVNKVWTSKEVTCSCNTASVKDTLLFLLSLRVNSDLRSPR